jgi:hypothetical protein
MIRSGGLSLPDVFDRVRLRVSENTKGKSRGMRRRSRVPFTFFDRAADAPPVQGTLDPAQRSTSGRCAISARWKPSTPRSRATPRRSQDAGDARSDRSCRRKDALRAALSPDFNPIEHSWQGFAPKSRRAIHSQLRHTNVALSKVAFIEYLV